MCRNSRAVNDDERQRLEVVGEFHLGEFVNRIRRGSPTMQVSGRKSLDRHLIEVSTTLAAYMYYSDD